MKHKIFLLLFSVNILCACRKTPTIEDVFIPQGQSSIVHVKMAGEDPSVLIERPNEEFEIISVSPEKDWVILISLPKNPEDPRDVVSKYYLIHTLSKRVIDTRMKAYAPFFRNYFGDDLPADPDSITQDEVVWSTGQKTQSIPLSILKSELIDSMSFETVTQLGYIDPNPKVSHTKSSLLVPAPSASEVLDGWLALQISSDSVLAKLGSADSSSLPSFSQATGYYFQTWRYSTLGLQIDLEANDSTMAQSSVRGFLIQAPCPFATDQKLLIGDSEKDVRIRYRGIPMREGSPKGSSLLIGSDYLGTIYYFKDAKITSIQVGSFAE